MELIRKNFINTTTMIVVNSGTGTSENIMHPDVRFQYYSNGLNNDATTATLRIAFDETLTVDRIALVGHNLKSFTIFYNNATANVFALTATGNTSSSDYSTNSATSLYLRCTPVACTSVSIDMKSTIVANQEKALGYLVISEERTSFDGRVPSSDGYSPNLDQHGVVHRLSDGGTRIQTIEDKWNARLSFNYMTVTARDELKTIFDDHDEMVFVPFGTTTGWDAVIFPCVWAGAFNFFTVSDNAANAGYSGSIQLMETPQ